MFDILTRLYYMEFAASVLWTAPFLIEGCLLSLLLYANIVDLEQTPSSAGSKLGLHCLPKSRLKGIWHKWVKRIHSFEI